MDFMKVDKLAVQSRNSEHDFNVTPDFIYAGVKDLVVRGGVFYAFWNQDHWSTSMDELIIAIDKETLKLHKQYQKDDPEHSYGVQLVNNDRSGVRKKLENYFKMVATPDVAFNTQILFSKDQMEREDYSTTKLSYTPTEGTTPNFDELMGTLYEPDQLNKILWFMGAVLTNSMPQIQKFMYLYGGKGTGKGTVIDIFKWMFEDYTSDINLATLTGNSEFSTAQVKEIPVLIDSDSDISHIRQDTNLLKLTAHEPLLVNKKFQSQYEVTFNGLLITASNQRYQVRNVDAGINRRAVVVAPSNDTLTYPVYRKLKSQIKFELPAIAYRAIKWFEEEGPARYENDMDVEMMAATDPVFDFVRENYVGLGDPCTLKRASELYKVYLEDLGWDTKGYKRRIQTELQRYYKSYVDKTHIDGMQVRSVYRGFKSEIVFPEGLPERENLPEIALEGSESAFDKLAADYPAQYANDAGTPEKAWDKVTTTLKDLDTKKLHYVQVPLNHIVIDLDLRDENGEKSLKKNLQKATEYPATYAELSKSGQGVHLHYLYEGNPEELDPKQSDGIEAKVYSGRSSLRRKVTACNSSEISHLAEGSLKIKKEEPTVYDDSKEMLWNEKKIRTAVEKNLRKEYHPATKPSIDFIAKILTDAVKAGVAFDIRDMRQSVLVFAMHSTNNSEYCVKVASKLPYSNKAASEKHPEDDIPEPTQGKQFYDDKDLVFFDIEVYTNLFIVCWKQYGVDEIHKWINPTPEQIESLVRHPLVGFNNRRYDNHILYARMLGEDNLKLFNQSQLIIGGSRNGFYSGSYQLAYADIYDYSSKKQSLKKWEVEMGIMHDEFELPWDKPVPEDMWDRAAEYCAHDVDATEKLFKHIYADYEARRILSELTGLPVNATTQQQAAGFLFGDDPRPQDKFVYTDLSTIFPGYEFKLGKSSYMGDDPSEGGYVYSEPGIYENVAEIDVASMHPTSAIALNYFGPYTERFKELKETRVLVKHHKFEEAGKAFNGALKPYLNPETADKLAYALKIIINIVYGLTSAKFENKFRQKQNVDNIIAKRGALFMIKLKHTLQDKGWTVVHIKTDSIKLNDITQEKIDFVMDFGKKYGYNFEVEHIFDKFALVNKAVNIGHVEDNPDWGKESNTWQAIGAQFADPYVFKRLFSHEEVKEKDYAITKQAKLPIYIGDQFVGKVAEVYASKTGGVLDRVNDEGKHFAVTGSKGFLWKLYSDFGGKEDIDLNYYDGLVKDAIATLDGVGKEGQAEKFLPKLDKDYESMLLPF